MISKKDLEKLIMSLMRVDTQNSGSDNFDGCTEPLLDFVKDRLAKKNIKVSIQKYRIEKMVNEKKIKLGQRGNLIAFVDRKKPIILLQGHVDTIPDLDGFKPGIKNGYVIGRGAVDMKGSVAGLIAAFEELAAKKDASFSPLLLLTSDEEANNFAGIKHFLKLNKKKIHFGICAEPSSFEIKHTFFGSMYCTLKIFGKEGHSSIDEDQNAIESSVEALDDMLKFKKFVSSQNIPGFGRSTMNIGVIKGGQKANQNPKECEIKFSIRNCQESKKYIEAFKEMVLEKIKARFEFKSIFSYDPITVSMDSGIKERFERAMIKNGLKVSYSVMRGFSEASFLNNAKIPTIVIGPGNHELSHVASKDEKNKVDDILIYSKLLVDSLG